MALVDAGLARSRTAARQAIEAGRVSVGGRVVTKPAYAVRASDALGVEGASRYVSRAAHKLLAALDAEEAAGRPLPIAGATALDVGASTGGFTEVLLDRGAAAVVAVDVGYGQLAWSLRTDPRVTAVERTNVRHLAPADIGAPAELVVADLSFISLTTVLPALISCAAPDADMVPMVKPQFEVGRAQVGSGVVADPQLRAGAVMTVAECARQLGWHTVGVSASPLPGPSGNVEYFLHLRGAPDRGPSGGPSGGLSGGALQNAVRDAVAKGPQ